MGVAELEALGALGTDKPEKLKAEIRRSEPVRAWGVPSTAISTGKQGETCIYTRQSNSSGTWNSHSITIVGGDVGRTQVTGKLGPSIEVLTNPTDVPGKPACR
jgi:hypothetical protein